MSQWITYILMFLLLHSVHTKQCQSCYYENNNVNCENDEVGLEHYTLHMSVHPHLDAFWIYNFETYYDVNKANNMGA